MIVDFYFKKIYTYNDFLEKLYDKPKFYFNLLYIKCKKSILMNKSEFKNL